MRLPLLIFPCTIKSRNPLLAPAHLGGPGKRAVKQLWCVGGGGDKLAVNSSDFTIETFAAGCINIVRAIRIVEKVTWQVHDLTYTETANTGRMFHPLKRAHHLRYERKPFQINVRDALPV